MRTRTDLCPGALRPWPAADGLLVRLRLIGGVVSSASLRALAAVAEEHADGRVHVTGRANLQVRGFSGLDGALTPAALAALEDTGLLPTRTHELVRNVMVSPGLPTVAAQPPRPTLHDVAAELDTLLCAEPDLAALPGRFLFVLDGRGDLLDRSCDLGLVALDDTEAQLRVGESWGPVVPMASAAAELAGLATTFVAERGTGPSAPWHVRELASPLIEAVEPDVRLPDPHPALPYGATHAGMHFEVPETGLAATAVRRLTAATDHVVVTPWRGVLVPEETR
ncbi:nitrite reductase [Nocardioides montaniterrae]